MSRLGLDVTLLLSGVVTACSPPRSPGLTPLGYSTCNGARLSGRAAIIGSVVWDSSGVPVQHRAVFLNDNLCTAAVDSLGQFVFANLDSGDYVVTVAPLWARRHPPVHVHLTQTDTARIAIRLLPPNDVLDCLDGPPCAPLLNVVETAQVIALSERDQLAEVALRTAIAMAKPFQVTQPPALCLSLHPQGDTTRLLLSTAVLGLLRRRYADTHLSSECEVVSSGEVNWHLQLKSDRRRAWSVEATLPNLTSDSIATGATSYHVASLWAAGWSCSYERRASRVWQPLRCVMLWIS